jgi:hypothetical protein
MINHMNKIKFISVICAALIAIPAIVAAQSAPSTGGSVSSAFVSSAPSTSGSVSSAASGSAPSTGDSVSSASSSGVPSTGSSVSSASSGSAPSTGGSVSSAGPGATPVPTPAPVSSGGGSSSSYGSSGSYSGGYSSGGSTVAPINGFCPFVSAIMDSGASNDAVQVAKLQAFLKDTEGYDVDLTGSFDQKTEVAVIAFQTKYMSDIMGPWGATKASGTVYLTTLKKINQIVCSTSLNLSAADLSIINAYKQAEASGASAGQVGVNQNANNSVAVGPSAPGSASSSDIFSTGNPNVAAAGQASIFTRFWNFLKSLF